MMPIEGGRTTPPVPTRWDVNYYFLFTLPLVRSLFFMACRQSHHTYLLAMYTYLIGYCSLRAFSFSLYLFSAQPVLKHLTALLLIPFYPFYLLHRIF